MVPVPLAEGSTSFWDGFPYDGTFVLKGPWDRLLRGESWE